MIEIVGATKDAISLKLIVDGKPYTIDHRCVCGFIIGYLFLQEKEEDDECNE